MNIKPLTCQLNKRVHQTPKRTWPTLVLSSHNNQPGSPFLRQPPIQSFLSSSVATSCHSMGVFTPLLECRFPPTLFPNSWALVLKGTKSQALLLSLWDGHSTLVITDSPHPPEEARGNAEGHRMCGSDPSDPSKADGQERYQLPFRTPWTLSDPATVPMGWCQALHRWRGQDL